MSRAHPLRDIRIAVQGAPHSATILRLTLLLLLLYGAQSPFLDVPLRVTCGLMLVFSSLSNVSYLWWFLCVVLIVGNGIEWYSIDNHKYLITYWTLACALSLGVSDGQEQYKYLRSSATMMVGLVFSFATLWKVIGGEYHDGTFMHMTLLLDPRVSYATSMLSGMSLEELSAGREAAAFLGRAPVLDTPIPLQTASNVRVVALVLSWLTLMGEGAVAVLHLRGRQATYTARHTLLKLFIVLTYLLLPVIGFAVVLTVMGFAECDQDDDHGRLEYVLLFALIHLTLIPWQPLLATLF